MDIKGNIIGKRIFALGFFDGVHLGHQALLRECVRLASETGAQAAAITFLRHPQSLFMENPPALINSDSDRETLLRQYGIGPVYKFPVTKEVMSTTWQVFLEELTGHGAVGFVCGDDFRFGFRGEGDGEKLRAFCAERSIPCIIVPEQTVDGVRVCSTHIRKLLAEGNMETATRFLGHPHILSGVVVSGRHLGRTIGVPTANLRLPEDVIAPRLGVYACLARIGGDTFPAVTNVGTRPTVGGSHITVEPWILGYEGDLYGKQISLEFYKFLRPEQKFESLGDLQAEIQKNAAQTLDFFENK